MEKFWIASNMMILLPCIKTHYNRHVSADGEIYNDGYQIIGWNWFDFGKGRWNSCGFETKEDAIKSYRRTYDLREVEFKIGSDAIVLSDELFKI